MSAWRGAYRGSEGTNGNSGSENPWKLRRFAASISDEAALKGCGRKVPRGDVGDADEILTFTRHCERAWLCPVCGYYAARDQSRELAKTLMAWTSKGGSVALLTLSQTHSTDDECSGSPPKPWRHAL